MLLQSNENASENETKPKFQHRKSSTVVFRFTQSVWSWLVFKHQYFPEYSFQYYFYSWHVDGERHSIKYKKFVWDYVHKYNEKREILRAGRPTPALNTKVGTQAFQMKWHWQVDWLCAK